MYCVLRIVVENKSFLRSGSGLLSPTFAEREREGEKESEEAREREKERTMSLSIRLFECG